MATPLNTLHPLDLEAQFVDYVWGPFKPYAFMLRHAIMQNIQAPQENPTPPSNSSSVPLKLPSMQARRAACTHLTMVRLNGTHECMICHRPSDLGWVYSCTQDDEQSTSSDTDKIYKEGAKEQVRLNPWVEKAVEKGHYTPTQVAILRAQKQKVNDAIAAAEEQFKKASARNSVDSDQAQQSVTSPSVDANPHLPYPVITKVEDAPTTNGSQAKLKVFPHCKFRSCHTCRPTYRDRAWQMLEPIFAVDFLTTVKHSLDPRRPVSDARVVRKIGLHEPLPTRPPLRSLDSIRRCSTRSPGIITYANGTSRHSTSVISPVALTDTIDISEAKTEPESRGFRDSVKRAFQGMLSSRKRDSTSSWSSSRSRRRARYAEDEDDGVEFDMGLWQHLNNELLQQASGVPLPGHDGMDGLSHEEGEIEVEDGVAVTEEGVDLGTADIIMSV